MSALNLGTSKVEGSTPNRIVTGIGSQGTDNIVDGVLKISVQKLWDGHVKNIRIKEAGACWQSITEGVNVGEYPRELFFTPVSAMENVKLY